ncbi:hypothetical protein [Nonomuraea typhae]|uniref:hypothetical protein n=1 Tax=Nonomuraea typhae TaxID=2603600 RepID=UPI0012FA5674|nr:hypothetical protein [Nonomuraea typhae]
MGRRLASRNVSIGAMTALSTLVLAACAQAAAPPLPAVDPPAYAEDAEDADEPADVTATCVRRGGEVNGRYPVAADRHCDGAGKHSAYMWYYGGTRIKKHVRDGTTRRPRGVTITTAAGDEIGRSGRISRDGFGGRDTTGS